jgi:hypothetical protein
MYKALDRYVRDVYISAMHFADFMAERKPSDGQVVDEIHCSHVTVSRIRPRKARPDWPVIEALRASSGGRISAGDFSNLEGCAAEADARSPCDVEREGHDADPGSED